MTNKPRCETRARVALVDCEAIFRAQEMNKRMKDKAAHACRALCRARVADHSHGWSAPLPTYPCVTSGLIRSAGETRVPET